MILAGEPFTHSRNQWDWLGLGIYLWEYAPARAHEWAVRRYGDDAAVLKASVRLGRCLNLLDTAHVGNFRRLYDERMEKLRAEGVRVPENRADGRHMLDRYMVDAYCQSMLVVHGKTFQTVRACFPEGPPIYPGSAILTQTHVQLAVRDPGCISDLRLVSW